MLLGEIIKEYREAHDLSLQDFANKIKTSRSYIHMLEKNVNPSTGKPINPSIDTLKSLAKAMDMNIDTLLKRIDNNQLIYLSEDKFKAQFEKKAIVIPVLGTIPAGVPLEAIEDVLDYEEISAEICKGNKEYFGLKVKGNSMSPEYLENDILIVLKQNDCDSGDDCVVMVNGNDATFKRVFKNDTGIILQPLNNQYQPIVYNNVDIDNFPVKIIGVVIEIRRNKKR